VCCRLQVKATEVTAGLAESNGSLLPGLWRDSLHVTCRVTACTPGSAPGPTLGNEYGKTLLYLLPNIHLTYMCFNITVNYDLCAPAILPDYHDEARKSIRYRAQVHEEGRLQHDDDSTKVSNCQCDGTPMTCPLHLENPVSKCINHLLFTMYSTMIYCSHNIPTIAWSAGWHYLYLFNCCSVE